MKFDISFNDAALRGLLNVRVAGSFEGLNFTNKHGTTITNLHEIWYKYSPHRQRQQLPIS